MPGVEMATFPERTKALEKVNPPRARVPPLILMVPVPPAPDALRFRTPELSVRPPAKGLLVPDRVEVPVPFLKICPFEIRPEIAEIPAPARLSDPAPKSTGAVTERELDVPDPPAIQDWPAPVRVMLLAMVRVVPVAVTALMSMPLVPRVKKFAVSLMVMGPAGLVTWIPSQLWRLSPRV